MTGPQKLPPFGGIDDEQYLELGAGGLIPGGILMKRASMADLRQIQEAIGELGCGDRQALLKWLIEADRKTWDEEISRDFSEGGVGMNLLAEMDEQINRGNIQAME